MVDVKIRTCIECKKIPIYKVEGETKVLYCATHKKDVMVDVKNPKVFGV